MSLPSPSVKWAYICHTVKTPKFQAASSGDNEGELLPAAQNNHRWSVRGSMWTGMSYLPPPLLVPETY